MSSSAVMPSLLHEFVDARWRDWSQQIAIDIPPGRGRAGRRLATYAEFIRSSHAIQARLQPFVEEECVVATLLPRPTVEAFASLLAIMRSGAGYTAIDPAFPDARVAELLAEAQAVVVLTDAAGAYRLERAGFPAGRTLIVSPADPVEPAEPGEPALWLCPSSLAYVIYTSGTTGRPKGVMVEHRAIANLVASDVCEFRLGAGDRVAQGSSLAYDSSIEEMWLAFASGATLVVLDDDVVRSGPDLIPWLDREGVTVFCPPPTLLRATGARDSVGLLPRLRLVYAGGEALPDDVVNVWAPGRRFVNGYGPTECAVVATRAEIRRGEPVTIGRPIPNVSAHVLNDDLEEAAPGAIGELCIGGAGLARGYRNQPELTAQKFPAHPTLGRLYRTGDLVRQAPDGTLSFLGRADAQVKIRGHRVELEDIEARLVAQPGVRAAACCVRLVDARPALVAFVVADRPDTAPAPDELRRGLARTLPAHMVPGRIRLLNELPVTAGGKLDRAALLDIEGAAAGAVAGEAAAAAPATRSPIEARIEAALRRILQHDAAIPGDANFFHDLGGDSLLAADLISSLRHFPDTAALTVRDAYEAPTIAALAARATAVAAAAAPEADPPLPTTRPPYGHPAVVTLVQSVWLLAGLIAASAIGYLLVFVGLPALADRFGALTTVLLLPVAAVVVALLYLPGSLTLAVLVKRQLIGRYAPLRAPVWSGFYARNWIVRQFLRLVPWRLIEGTVFQLAALRALGARVGQRVHIHRGVDMLQGGWDLLDIGDDATIGQEAVIQLVDLDDEQIVVAPVTIGAGATIEIRASLAGGSIVRDGGYLAALSSLPAGVVLPAGERWDGVPAAPAGLAPAPPPIDSAGREWSPAAHGAAMVLTRLASSLMAPTLVSLVAAWLIGAHGFDAQTLEDLLETPLWSADLVALALIAGVLPAPLSVIGYLILIRLLGPVGPGVISRWSVAYFRVWAKTDLVRKSGDWLSGTLMWPMWLRAAGMRVGRDCEISTIIDVVPELVEVGSSTFLADGIYLGGPRVHRGTVTLARTHLGNRVFTGNHVVIPAGRVVADGVLLGVSTVADERATTPDSAWFGHPPFALARPPQPPLDPRLTHRPTFIRYVNRWIWEIGRFAIPVAPMLTLLALAQSFVRASTRYSDAAMAFVIAPALLVCGAAALCLLVLALKWLLLGRVKPGEHALWSCWCSRWDFHYTVWDRLATPFLSRLEGTLILSWYLRAAGMRIGKRVVLGPGFAQVVDPDMIQIDDDATVHALFQAHTFEDRLLKIDRVRVRARATVGCGAVLFYGVDVGEGASVAPQSVIMKREVLRAGGRYEGAPSQIKSSLSEGTP